MLELAFTEKEENKWESVKEAVLRHVCRRSILLRIMVCGEGLWSVPIYNTVLAEDKARGK